MSTLSFYCRVIDETGQADREAVKRGTAAVLHALRDRLMPTEAAQAAAQLPRGLKDVWNAGDRPDRKPDKMHRKDFYERVRRDAGLKSARQARFLIIGVFAALKQHLSSGEADDVLAQLPRDLKEGRTREMSHPRDSRSGMSGGCGGFDAGLTDEFRGRLLAARDMLLRTVTVAEAELEGVGALEAGDLTDRATAASITSLGSRLTGQDKRELDEIAEALRRLGSGAYGTCEACQRPIGLARLRVVPAARLCVSCQEAREVVP